MSRPEKLQPTLVRLPPEMIAALKARGAAEDRSMSGTVRHACRLYLDKAGEGDTR